MKKIVFLIAVVGIAFFVSCGKEPVRVSGITIPPVMTITVGDKYRLEATVLPENADNKELVWLSDDPQIATCDPATGEVTGIDDGEVTITATSADGEARASCRVTVEKIKITPADLAGTWRTTHQYHRQDISPEFVIEELEELGWAEEREVSVDVTEADGYLVTFREGGTGYGSGLRFEEEGRYTFSFSWRSSDDHLSISKIQSSVGDVYDNRFYWTFLETGWEMKELTADKMVMEFHSMAFVDNFDGGGPPGWTEEYTYRYTFERVE